jgi:hypothetical protein
VLQHQINVIECAAAKPIKNVSSRWSWRFRPTPPSAAPLPASSPRHPGPSSPPSPPSLPPHIGFFQTRVLFKKSQFVWELQQVRKGQNCSSFHFRFRFCLDAMVLRHWQCRAVSVAHSSGKDSVIKGQPFLLFMLWAGD